MKILLVGLGSIGQRHVRNLRTLLGDEVELFAYRVRGLRHVITEELTNEPVGDVEAQYGIKTFLNMDEALAKKPDAVFVTNPNSLHIPVALAAAKAGCHLFIEKPLSHNFDGVQELMDLIERKRLVCLIGYQLRFHPGLKQLKNLLEEEVVGRVLTARLEFGEYLPSWHRYEDYRQYHASRQDQGGGVLLSQIHDLDYAYVLFGMPRRVFARGGKLSDLEIDVEDTVGILMECWVKDHPVPVHIHQDLLQRPPARQCEVIGDKGKILWDYYGNRLTLTQIDRKDPETYRWDGFTRNQLFIDEMRHFLACLSGKEMPVVSVREGAMSLRIALAAKQSVITGEVVELG